MIPSGLTITSESIRAYFKTKGFDSLNIKSNTDDNGNVVIVINPGFYYSINFSSDIIESSGALLEDVSKALLDQSFSKLRTRYISSLLKNEVWVANRELDSEFTIIYNPDKISQTTKDELMKILVASKL
jgi:hypothetical protein